MTTVSQRLAAPKTSIYDAALAQKACAQKDPAAYLAKRAPHLKIVAGPRSDPQNYSHQIDNIHKYKIYVIENTDTGGYFGTTPGTDPSKSSHLKHGAKNMFGFTDAGIVRRFKTTVQALDAKYGLEFGQGFSEGADLWSRSGFQGLKVLWDGDRPRIDENCVVFGIPGGWLNKQARGLQKLGLRKDINYFPIEDAKHASKFLPRRMRGRTWQSAAPGFFAEELVLSRKIPFLKSGYPQPKYANEGELRNAVREKLKQEEYKKFVDRVNRRVAKKTDDSFKQIELFDEKFDSDKGHPVRHKDRRACKARAEAKIERDPEYIRELELLERSQVDELPRNGLPPKPVSPPSALGTAASHGLLGTLFSLGFGLVSKWTSKKNAPSYGEVTVNALKEGGKNGAIAGTAQAISNATGGTGSVGGIAITGFNLGYDATKVLFAPREERDFYQNTLYHLNKKGGGSRQLAPLSSSKVEVGANEREQIRAAHLKKLQAHAAKQRRCSRVCNCIVL